MSDEIVIRKAALRDCAAILGLINDLAIQQVLLPRSPASVIENVRDFYVAEGPDGFVGCGALHIVWTDLAEIRSIAVDPKAQAKGIGRRLIDAMVREAEQLDLPRLFAFTYVQGFFEKVGFQVVAHGSLPHKVFNDCLHCPKFTACDEIAMERVLRPGDDTVVNFGIPVTQIPIPRRPHV